MQIVHLARYLLYLKASRVSSIFCKIKLQFTGTENQASRSGSIRSLQPQSPIPHLTEARMGMQKLASGGRAASSPPAVYAPALQKGMFLKL